jgi:hypothetical protein
MIRSIDVDYNWLNIPSGLQKAGFQKAELGLNYG